MYTTLALSIWIRINSGFADTCLVPVVEEWKWNGSPLNVVFNWIVYDDRILAVALSIFCSDILLFFSFCTVNFLTGLFSFCCTSVYSCFRAEFSALGISVTMFSPSSSCWWLGSFFWGGCLQLKMVFILFALLMFSVLYGSAAHSELMLFYFLRHLHSKHF